MVKWAESAPERDVEPNALVEEDSSLTDESGVKVSAAAFLDAWRQSRRAKEEKAEKEREEKLQHRDNVARIQRVLSSSKGTPAELHAAKLTLQEYGGYDDFLSTLEVSQHLQSLSKSLVKEQHAQQVKEQQQQAQRIAKAAAVRAARIRAHTAAHTAGHSKLAGSDGKTVQQFLQLLSSHAHRQGQGQGQGGKGRGGGGGSAAAAGYGGGSPTSCAMCLYLMEHVEREVGYPTDLTADSDPQATGQSPNYPGPAAYVQGYAGQANIDKNAYTPIPGPGYTTLLQLHQQLLTAAASLPPSAAKATATATAKAAKASVPTPSTAQATAGATSPTTATAKPAAAAAATAASKPAAGSRQPVVPGTAAAVAAGMLPAADKYDPAHDPFLGMRHKFAPPTAASALPRRLSPAAIAAAAAAASSSSAAAPGAMLEEGEQQQQRGTAASLLARGGTQQGRFIGSLVKSAVGAAKSALTSALGCPIGRQFCRKRLKGMGRRAIDRKRRQQAKASQMASTVQSLVTAVQTTCSKLPPSYARFCKMYNDQLLKVTSEYLHDYDNNEICVDINMCTAKALGIQEGNAP